MDKVNSLIKSLENKVKSEMAELDSKMKGLKRDKSREKKLSIGSKVDKQ